MKLSIQPTFLAACALLLSGAATAGFLPAGRYSIDVASDAGAPGGKLTTCLTPEQAATLASWARTMEQPLWKRCTVSEGKVANAWSTVCENDFVTSTTSGTVQVKGDSFEAQTETTMGTMTVKARMSGQRVGECR